MAESFLHGVEIIEDQGGARPTRTVRSSVIGLIGTAPDARAAVAAAATSGTETGNDGITYTAVTAGAAGNSISIYLKDPKANSAVLAVSVAGTDITVSLATDAGGAVTTTAAEVIAALAADAKAALLLGAAATGASTGATVVTPMVKALALAGGIDEAFPLLTPVLVAGSRQEAAGLDTVGAGAGTLPAVMDDIFDQSGAVVVVIRVAEGVDAAATKANVIAAVPKLLDAQSKVGFTPRILIAPGWTGDQAVVAEMLTIADQLRGVIVADGPNTNDADAITYRGNFGSRRVYVVDPSVKVFDTLSASEVVRPASGRVAGLIARSDNERGFHHSPSNQEIYGITGLARDIDFQFGDANCRANLLNEQEVTTIIRKDGYRLWGNRTCSADPKWAFLSVVRTNDMINESILQAHLWAVDRNITKTYVEDVLEGVNAYLRSLTARGIILGGKAWADPALNTPDMIAQGNVTFDYEFTPPYPAERITMRSHLVNNYITEVFA